MIAAFDTEFLEICSASVRGLRHNWVGVLTQGTIYDRVLSI